MVKMHNSTFVTTICTISLKVFSRLIKYKRNALNGATSTLYYICSHLDKCKSIQESPNFYMDGKDAYPDSCDLNLYIIS